jgi:hypothetical protein
MNSEKQNRRQKGKVSSPSKEQAAAANQDGQSKLRNRHTASVRKNMQKQIEQRCEQARTNEKTVQSGGGGGVVRKNARETHPARGRSGQHAGRGGAVYVALCVVVGI